MTILDRFKLTENEKDWIFKIVWTAVFLLGVVGIPFLYLTRTI